MPTDAIEFLLGQHEQVKELLDAVQSSKGEERQQNFDALRELLAVHETAEELILRPATRKDVQGGDEIADARMKEENEAKDVLAKLENLDVDSEEFSTTFSSFADDVREHAGNEEKYEFPALRDAEDAEELSKMAQRLETAEKLAPTHPHPSARSTAANVVLGPFAALLDKARDALSS